MTDPLVDSPARADGRPPGQVVAAAVLASVQAAAVAVASAAAAFFVFVLVQLAADLDVPSGLPVAELLLLAVVQLSSIAVLVTGGVRVLRRRDRTSRSVLVGALVLQLVLSVYWTARLGAFLSADESFPFTRPAFILFTFALIPAVALGLLSTRRSQDWSAGRSDRESTPHR